MTLAEVFADDPGSDEERACFDEWLRPSLPVTPERAYQDGDFFVGGSRST